MNNNLQKHGLGCCRRDFDGEGEREREKDRERDKIHIMGTLHATRPLYGRLLLGPGVGAARSLRHRL